MRSSLSEQLIESTAVGPCPVVVEPDVSLDNRRQFVQTAVGMDDSEIIEGV